MASASFSLFSASSAFNFSLILLLAPNLGLNFGRKVAVSSLAASSPLSLAIRSSTDCFSVLLASWLIVVVASNRVAVAASSLFVVVVVVVAVEDGRKSFGRPNSELLSPLEKGEGRRFGRGFSARDDDTRLKRLGRIKLGFLNLDTVEDSATVLWVFSAVVVFVSSVGGGANFFAVVFGENFEGKDSLGYLPASLDLKLFRNDAFEAKALVLGVASTLSVVAVARG